MAFEKGSPTSLESSSNQGYDFGIKPNSGESLKIDATIAFHKDQFVIRQALRKKHERKLALSTAFLIAFVAVFFLVIET